MFPSPLPSSELALGSQLKLTARPCLVDKRGKVRKVDVVKGLGYGLNEAAVKGMMGFRFKPAQVDGEPVAVKIRYNYRFELER